MTEAETAVREALAKMTPGPWVWEQCGDKEDAPVVGIAYAADDLDCAAPLSGKLVDQDAYRESIARDWFSCDGVPPSRNAAGIVALKNHTPALLAELDAARAEVARLREALARMVYEATHLSPMKPNGDHDCTIKADALEQARAALQPQA